jgi:adenine-specific DNA-methyltransferase
MTAPLSSQQSALLALVPADGSTVGNTSLREQLGWDEVAYTAVRDELVAAGLIEKGKGRGGSVKRIAAAAPKTELFAAEEVESVIPELERARRASAETAAAKKEKAPAAAAPFTEHRHSKATRKNLPAAGDALGHVEEAGKITYAYDSHRPPVLRFNEGIVGLRELLDESRRRPLTVEEAEKLAALLEAPQPWLEWTGKRETPDFAVEPVALHIHERVSAQAILKAVRREDIQRDLFAEGAQSAKEARAYYQHDVAWANRLITGDSLQVMTSLARREGLAGQVQMIYFDPPYGIKFSSNWQNEVGKRDVKDKDEDLTREPEMIRAYRDTWTLGVHSYLAYLKQRLILARELLKDSGSIFVQIGEENLHRVRAVLDEVFGGENSVAFITVKKTAGQDQELLNSTADFVLWYARDKERVKFKRLLIQRELEGEEAGPYGRVKLLDGTIRSLTSEEQNDHKRLPAGAQIYRISDTTSSGTGGNKTFPYEFRGKTFEPKNGRHWSTNEEGLKRLELSERFQDGDTSLSYVRFHSDFGCSQIDNVWTDTGVGGFTDKKVYVVQTVSKIVQRCMLMATEPGDLVLDPTCGSGTTAYVAEQWGRRWITIDSSRVAVAIARQRLLTACYDSYKTKDPVAGVDPSAPQNPAHGFYYKTVPHIALKSIAQNKGLDPIFAKHEPILAARLDELNAALAAILAPQAPALRQKLVAKLLAKHVADGANAVTDADYRRCLLPGTDKALIQPGKKITPKQVESYRAAIPSTAAWREWEVPFDADPEWPAPLGAALTAYRTAWRAKMDEINAAIAANAEQEELVDQPEPVRGVARVAGPFTVESMRPPETSLKGEADQENAPGPIGGAPGELEAFETTTAPERDVTNAASHIERMLELLKHDGLTFTGNKHVKFTQLDAIESSFLHAEGEFQADDAKPHRVAIVIGPEFGSVTSYQVDNALRVAHRRGYDDVVFAGFSFDATAQETIQAYNDEPRAEVRLHMAQIRPDVGMKDLLKKTQKVEQIFTVFGQPRTRVEPKAGEVVVHMDGVDLYDPVANALQATSAGKVAAWFLDTDYDGKVFCICQAFFPDKTAWDKLARALKTSVSEGAFEALSGTTSLPFKPGPRQCVAVKVIDPRGNEVMRVHRLDGKYPQGGEE